MSSPSRFARWLSVLLYFALVAAPVRSEQPAAKVYVLLWFDTEDYLLPASDDSAKHLAEFLTSEGIQLWRYSDDGPPPGIPELMAASGQRVAVGWAVTTCAPAGSLATHSLAWAVDQHPFYAELVGEPVLTWWQGTINNHGFGLGVDEPCCGFVRFLFTGLLRGLISLLRVASVSAVAARHRGRPFQSRK